MRLYSKLPDDLLCQDGHSVVNHDLLLAARAVQVAKRDAQRRPLVLQHHQDTVGVEDVPTGHSNAGLIAKLSRETNSTKLVLSGSFKDARWFFSLLWHTDGATWRIGVFS